MNAERFLRRIVSRPELSPVLLVLLIAAAGEAGESSWVSTFRGQTWIRKELGDTQVQGYYEALLNKPAAPRAAAEPAPRTDGANVVRMLPFRDSGIVAEEPTYLRWRMRPSQTVHWNGTVFTTNDLGFRTPPVERPKPKGTYRIVLLGSSNTMGHGVDDDAMYPRLLERWLNARFVGAPRVEVVNLAVSADSPTRRLLRLAEEGPRLEPDWVLSDASPLDYLHEENHLRIVVESRIAIPFDFVRTALRRSGVEAGDSAETFHRKLSGQCEALIDGAYRGWYSESAALGVRCAVVLLPRSDMKVESPIMFRLFRRLAAQNGLDCIDLSRAFRDLKADQLAVSSIDRHPSVTAHSALADEFRAALEERGGLPGLPFPNPPVSAD